MMESFEDVYNLFFEPGEVTEIRAYGLSRNNSAWEGWAGGAGVVYGYFNDPEAFARAAKALEKNKAPGIYFTINPTLPELLARAANRLKAASQKSPQTSDNDIKCIRWLPIDVDPIRPAGISSTNNELEAAVRIRDRIAEYIEQELLWPPGIRALSGNGTHLVYRRQFDWKNTAENAQSVKDCLFAIADKFTNKWAEVDRKVFNPSRIWKLYGTTARKGDHTEERPHRKSYIENRKEE